MLLDLADNLYIARGLSPVAAGTDNTAYVSQIFDCANKTGVCFAILFGTNTDADVTFTVLVEDGDNSALSDNAAVDDAYLTGVEAMGLDYADDNTVSKIGYTGTKRYVRVTITPANNGAGNIYIAGCWIAQTKKLPQSTQVV